MSDDVVRFTLVLLIGSGAQLVDGMFGMGFGVFSASLLLATGFSPVITVATVNVAKVLTGVTSGLAHWQMGNIRRDWLLPLIGPGVIGGVLGAKLLVSLPPETVHFLMSVVLAGMGLLILYRALFQARKPVVAPSETEPGLRLIRRVGLGMVGFVAGFLNALSGAYGPFATAAVLLASRAKPFRVVGSVSLAEFFVAVTVAATVVSSVGVGGISWMLMLALTLGGALTALPAAYLCRHLPSRTLLLCIGVALVALNVGGVVSGLR